MRTQRTIGIVVIACLVVGLTTVAWLIAWLGVGPALSLVAVSLAAYLLAIGPWQRRWGHPRRGEPGAPGRRPAPRRRAVDDEGDHDRRPTRARLPLVTADRIRPRRVVQLRLDRQRRPSERGAHRARDGVRGRPPNRDVAGVRPRRAGHRTGSARRQHGETDSWCLFVEPAGDCRTRPISRWKQDWPRTPTASVWIAIADPGAFIMERRMLLRIRELAERSAAAAPR